MKTARWIDVTLALALLWLVILWRHSYTTEVQLTLSAPLPYGCSNSEQLRSALNNHLRDQKDLPKALKSAFQDIGHYHALEVRCADQNHCTIYGERSPALALWFPNQLLLTQPLRLASNSYGYQPSWVIDSMLYPSEEIAQLAQYLSEQSLFDGQSPPQEGLITIWADGTTKITPTGTYPEIWISPLTDAITRWQQFRPKVPVPWESLESCDLRYISGGAYLKKNTQSSKKS